MVNLLQGPAVGARNAIAAACLLTLVGAAQADVVAWNWVSGPGTLTSTQFGNVATLTEASVESSFGTRTWIAEATVGDAGDYTFDFRLNGFFAYFNVVLTLSAVDSGGTTTILNEGPASCGACNPPSGGFDYTGTYTFAGLGAGENIRFVWTGVNFDSNRTMNSTLTLTQRVPEPATLALVGLGLIGAAAARRQRT